MIKQTFLTLAIGLLFFLSCEKVPTTVTGFDTAVQKNSSGSVSMQVGNNAESVLLMGTITLMEGELEISLKDPHDHISFSSIVQTTAPFSISKEFEPVQGLWKLEYKSLQGEGTIDLHLSSR